MGLIPRIAKYSGWLLLVMIAFYVLTGFAYIGYLGLDAVINPGYANLLHSNLWLSLVLILLTFLHCCLRMSARLLRRFRRNAPDQPQQAEPVTQPAPQTQPPQGSPQPAQPGPQPQPAQA